MTTSQSQFNQWVEQGYTRIPVVREMSTDSETPLSLYKKLAQGPFSFLFESIQGGEQWGHFSIIGLPAKEMIKVVGNKVEHFVDGEVVESVEQTDPLTWIQNFQSRFKVPTIPELRFSGGLVGYFGYDSVRYIEPKLGAAPAEDAIQSADILLLVSDELCIYDNINGTLDLIVYVDADEAKGFQRAQDRLDVLETQLQETKIQKDTVLTRSELTEDIDMVSEFDEADFKSAVEKIKQYIVDGDVMQVVLAQRMHTSFQQAPLDLYCAVRQLNPSPYLYFMDMDDFQIVGSSPEILVRLENQQVTVRPLAGTRKRGASEEEDKQLEQALLADPKELAEHLMLIDLGRNDIGRVCVDGTVKLTEKMQIERYSHVMHIVSNVIGQVKAECDAIDVLKATFPAGTVSGAPKVRAMEIIDKLEPVKRGVYAGAVGYLAWNGNMDVAIAIRTAVVQNQTLYVQAGAGIVYDSVPDNEWEETLNKGRVILKAAEMAKAVRGE